MVPHLIQGEFLNALLLPAWSAFDLRRADAAELHCNFACIT
jgi:hypothetical protein